MTEGKRTVGLVLGGLDGANPLAFLAALGALRGLTLAWPTQRVCMFWGSQDAWRPHLNVDDVPLSEEKVLEGLEQFLLMRPGHKALNIGDNLKIGVELFRHEAKEAAEESSPDDRARADFVAAFGCDAVHDGKGSITDTALRTMSGAGHQHFLKTIRDLGEKATRESLKRCLFGPWTRQDSRLSLRWDPEDDRRYALRFRNPTASGEQPRTEWGANRLAFEAIPLLPVMPLSHGVATTGFTGQDSRDTFWSWPIWELPVDLDTVRTMLALRELQESTPSRGELAARGIREVYRSQRLTVGKYRNFTPARPV